MYYQLKVLGKPLLQKTNRRMHDPMPQCCDQQHIDRKPKLELEAETAYRATATQSNRVCMAAQAVPIDLFWDASHSRSGRTGLQAQTRSNSGVKPIHTDPTRVSV